MRRAHVARRALAQNRTSYAMPSNKVLIASLFVALAVAAVALRIATGPIVTLKDGDTLYALAKSGPVARAPTALVELAVSDARPER
jgi:hypothetical protein